MHLYFCSAQMKLNEYSCIPTYETCEQLQLIGLPRARTMFKTTHLIIFVFALIRKVSGSSATCVNFPFAFSKSAWY